MGKNDVEVIAPRGVEDNPSIVPHKPAVGTRERDDRCGGVSELRVWVGMGATPPHNDAHHHGAVGQCDVPAAAVPKWAAEPKDANKSILFN